MVTRKQSEAGAPLALAMLAAGALIGCARASAPIVQPMDVRVPIPTPIYCSITIPPHPALPIAKLTDSSAPADTARAYAASVVMLKAAVIEREQLLTACAPPTKHGVDAKTGSKPTAAVQ